MDERITHQVIDRPKPLINHENRVFIQPQWVFDSSNARVLVNTTKYAPGVVPPPHLSPFVQPSEDDHVPEYAKEIQALKEAAHRTRIKATGEAIDEEFLGRSKTDDEVDASLVDLEQQHAEELAKELKEATGKDVQRPSSRSKTNGRGGDLQDDAAAMKDIMMTRKVKRAYQKAMQEKASKRAKTARLAKKAASLKTI
jgi:pescadillo protein